MRAFMLVLAGVAVGVAILNLWLRIVTLLEDWNKP